MKYSKLDLGKIEAIVNKLGGYEGVHQFLSGETCVVEKKQLAPFESVFYSIVEIQNELQNKFKKAGIKLSLVTVCNTEENPSFSGSAINDATGSSLDIEFKNEQGHFLIFHLFNRKAFCLTFNTYGTTNIYPLNKLDDKDFLEGLKKFFNKKDYVKGEDRKAALEFIDNFRK